MKKSHAALFYNNASILNYDDWNIGIKIWNDPVKEEQKTEHNVDITIIIKLADVIKYAYLHHDEYENKHMQHINPGQSVMYLKYWFHNAMENLTWTTSTWAWV